MYDGDVFVATKLGRHPEPGWPDNFTYETMRQHTENSLRHLEVEALDLTQLHCIPTDELRKGEVFDHLRRLQQEGLIKRFGASVESMEEALICLEQEGLASLQIIFNIFRQKPIHTLFDKAKEKGVALIVRLPLASGLLAGKFTVDSNSPRMITAITTKMVMPLTSAKPLPGCLLPKAWPWPTRSSRWFRRA